MNDSPKRSGGNYIDSSRRDFGAKGTEYLACKGEGLYCCPECFGPVAGNGSGHIVCCNCSRKFEIREGIPVFTGNEIYWCNFPRETMNELNKIAEAEGFQEALSRVIKDEEIRNYIVEESRIDPLFFLPITRESIILDIGCKWGGLTVPFSDYCKAIVGIDTTYETLKFLEIRKQQMKKYNIYLALASALNLPFADNSFDVAILNGVLEWLGYKDDFDATKDYGIKKSELKIQKENPFEFQKQGLENIYRVLKPGGIVMIGIENRFGLEYLMGAVEDHANLRYVGVMPRFIANWYMKKKLNQEFRTYTYSMPALRRILRDIGFFEIEFLAAFESYREPEYIFSLENPALLKYFLKNHRKNLSRNLFKRAVWNFLVQTGSYKFFVPSFLVLAKK